MFEIKRDEDDFINIFSGEDSFCIIVDEILFDNQYIVMKNNNFTIGSICTI